MVSNLHIYLQFINLLVRKGWNSKYIIRHYVGSVMSDWMDSLSEQSAAIDKHHYSQMVMHALVAL